MCVCWHLCSLHCNNFSFLSWLYRVFVALRGFFSVAESEGYSSCGVQASHWRAWALGMAFRAGGTWAQQLQPVLHRLSSSATRGIFPDQGSNPCLLNWQADSLPLNHQGSPTLMNLIKLRKNVCVTPLVIRLQNILVYSSHLTDAQTETVKSHAFIHSFVHLSCIYWVLLCASLS